MKAITKYQSYDGREFTCPIACSTYEDHSREADRIIAQFPTLPKDDSCRFANGHGYIQHSLEMVAKVRRELLEQAAKEVKHHFITLSLEKPDCHPSWAGRIIGECCTDGLYRAWLRISCIDAQGREWGQPYYRDNPDKAEQIQLNL